MTLPLATMAAIATRYTRPGPCGHAVQRAYECACKYAADPARFVAAMRNGEVAFRAEYRAFQRWAARPSPDRDDSRFHGLHVADFTAVLDCYADMIAAAAESERIAA